MSIDRRSGRPYERDFVEEKKIMFLSHLFTGPVGSVASIGLIRRDLFSCIFGTISFDVRTLLNCEDSADVSRQPTLPQILH
jgi:hypothetical protein